MSRKHATMAIIFAIIAILAFAAPALGKGKPTPVTVLGNNVSVPVVFSEGYNIVGGDVSAVGSGFRSTELVDNFATTTFVPRYWTGVLAADGTYVDLAGALLLSNYFFDQKTDATWQAEWVDATDPATPMSMVAVDRLDWGDSLLSKAWTVRSKIRLEIRLYRVNDLTSSYDGTTGLKGYGMNHVYGSGISEVWAAADSSLVGATDGPSRERQLYTPAYTTVYSNCARLSLSRIQALGDTDPSDDVPIFSMPVADKYGTDGPTGFGAEVNVGGYVLYGYTLDAKARRLAAGYYRVMFSLDESATWSAGTVYRNTVITGLDEIDSIRDSGTESEWPFKSEMNAAGTASWVDIQLIAR
jgi:hypothetical protein